MTIRYRAVEPQDNVSLARVIRACLEEFDAVKQGTVYFDPTTDALYELFQTPNSSYIVAEGINDDGTATLVGGCGLFPTEGLPADTIELVKLYLAPSVRGLGVGKALMEKCLDTARTYAYKAVYLESLPELTIAVPMYERMGFVHLDCALGVSGHGGCSIWMLKQL
jgi:putative acetyltransferase